MFRLANGLYWTAVSIHAIVYWSTLPPSRQAAGWLWALLYLDCVTFFLFFVLFWVAILRRRATHAKWILGSAMAVFLVAAWHLDRLFDMALST